MHLSRLFSDFSVRIVLIVYTIYLFYLAAVYLILHIIVYSYQYNISAIIFQHIMISVFFYLPDCPFFTLVPLKFNYHGRKCRSSLRDEYRITFIYYKHIFPAGDFCTLNKTTDNAVLFPYVPPS